jgi:hypothetical protein
MPPKDYDYGREVIMHGIDLVRELLIGDSIIKSKIYVEIEPISLAELENEIPQYIISLVQPLVDSGFRPQGFVQ